MLTTLNLEDNYIDDEGMPYLANAFKINAVKNIYLFISFIFISLSLSNQTLTTLCLYHNKICLKGALILADALQHNTVKFIVI